MGLIYSVTSFISDKHKRSRNLKYFCFESFYAFFVHVFSILKLFALMYVNV